MDLRRTHLLLRQIEMDSLDVKYRNIHDRLCAAPLPDRQVPDGHRSILHRHARGLLFSIDVVHR